jgi:hypothetical protein
MVIHSMSHQERGLALDVLAAAWRRVSSEPGVDLVAAVESAADALAARNDDVSSDYARHLAAAAVWYLDRAVRRVADADLDGHSSAQRAANLAWFVSVAAAPDVERLFAMAAALNADDA